MVFGDSLRQLQMVKGAAPGDTGAGDAVVLGMAEAEPVREGRWVSG